MNREIKFRAWDFEEKTMLGDISDGMMMQMNSGRIGFYDDDLNWVEGEDYIPMQYTGLKDKNGKEIYEGDIVKVEYFDSREMMGEDAEYTDHVYFDTDAASFMIKRPTGADTLEHDLGKSIEVIGNIYQNPELLKQ